MDLFSYLLGKKSGGTPIPPTPAPSLPDDYTLLNYLEATGTQYINIGYIPNENTKIRLKCFQKSQAGYNKLVFGAKQPYNETQDNIFYSISSASGKVGLYYNVGSGLSSGVAIGDMTDVTIEKTKFTVNGTEVSDYEIDTYPTIPLYLFAQNSNGTPTDFGSVRIGSFKIYENDILIHNYVPCKRNVDSILGMYDLVEQVFKTNDGTGTFSYSDTYIL